MSPNLSSAQLQEMRSIVRATRQRQFKEATFVQDNYRPPTGVGLFSCKYTPWVQRVVVRVKVFFEFLTPARDASYLAWTAQEMMDFPKKAAKVITETWSNRYQFICKDPDFSTLRASVNIAIEEVPRNQAQYIIEVRKVDRNHNTAWSGGCLHGASVWPYTADFSNWGVEVRSDFSGDKVFNFKEMQLKEALKLRNVAVIPFLSGTDNLTPDVSRQLTQFTTEAKRILGNDVKGIFCNIVGFSTEKFGSQRARARANRVFDSVKQALPQFFRVAETPEAKAVAEKVLTAGQIQRGKFSGVVLSVDVPPATLRNVATNYVIITHEFGHMIGCPDEYYGVFCTGIREKMQLDEIIPASMTPALTNVKPLQPGQHFTAEKPADNAVDNQKRWQAQQTVFASLMEQAEVSSPVFAAQNFGTNNAESRAASDAMYAERDRLRALYGRDSEKYKKLSPQDSGVTPLSGASDSIMFTGQKVLPAHYLPIWACLTSMTREFIDPTDWTIAPV